MQLLVISAVLVSALAVPHKHHFHSSVSDSSYGYGGQRSNDRLEAKYGVPPINVRSYSICSGGKVLSADGQCVYPIINRSFYLYAAPKRVYNYGPPPYIPKPKLNYNVVFVGTPERPEPQDPIVVPPAQQQTVVYVLSKDEKPQPPKVIQIPDQPRTPEIYYINYEEGENAQLPGGIDLNSALKSANERQGVFINKIKDAYETEKSEYS